MKKGKYLTCPVCNKTFYRKPSDIYGKNIKISYCSHKCHYEHKFIRTLEEATEQYSKSWQELIYKWYVIDKIPVRQISKKLSLSNRVVPRALRLLNIPQRSIHDRVTLQWKNNDQRKEESSKRMSEFSKGKPSWNKGLTKKSHPSIKRQANWMVGANNPMYGKRGKAHHAYKNGNYTAEKKRYWSTSEYQQWRKAVYERDNYTCQRCGDNKGGNLNAHHIKPWADFPELRYVVSNGVTLCVKCHHIAHSSIQALRLQRQETCLGGASISQ